MTHLRCATLTAALVGVATAQSVSVFWRIIAFSSNAVNCAASGSLYDPSVGAWAEGLWVSGDGAASWSAVAAIADQPGNTTVAGLAISGDGFVLYVAMAAGLYRSVDRGASFVS